MYADDMRNAWNAAQNICDNVNNDNPELVWWWQPCGGSIVPEKNKIGFMCETARGRVYIASTAEQSLFYVDYVRGEHSPFDDWGSHVVKCETYNPKDFDSVEDIIRLADSHAELYI